MVRNIVNSARKVRPFVFTVAYALVLSDLLNLAQEVAQEFVLSRFFPHKAMEDNIQMSNEIVQNIKNDLEQTSEFENVENGVTDVTKRNDSYKFLDNSGTSIHAEMASQADGKQALPETV